MRLEPALPSTSSTSPSAPSTTVGAIIDGIRRPGGAVKKPSGLRSSSPMTLLRWMPVPGTTSPEPSPLVHVTAHAPPSPSSTETCVVEPRLGGEEAIGKPGSASPATKAGVRACLRLRHRVDAAPPATAPPGRDAPSRRASASASSVPPADGGGLVSDGRGRGRPTRAGSRAIGA